LQETPAVYDSEINVKIGQHCQRMIQLCDGAPENARHENSAQRKLQGVENAGLEN